MVPDEYQLSELADSIEAIEAEMRTLAGRDPLDPQIGRLSHQLTSAMRELYESVPRGV